MYDPQVISDLGPPPPSYMFYLLALCDRMQAACMVVSETWPLLAVKYLLITGSQSSHL